jgi:hypothetical protein
LHLAAQSVFVTAKVCCAARHQCWKKRLAKELGSQMGNALLAGNRITPYSFIVNLGWVCT